MDIQLAVFQIIVLIFSAIVHEVSHGAVANYLGDPTAKHLGRLTLNPMKHLEPFGSFVFPLLMYIASAGKFVFGWAKPVPYNPDNLKDPRWGAALIAVVGPLTNLAIAAVFGLILRFMHFPETFFFETLVQLFIIVVFINILLAVFNLVPIPPLDGSKILFAALGSRMEEAQRFLEQNGFILLLLFIFFGFQVLMPIIYALFALFTGMYI